FIHRDIKPDNYLVRVDPDTGRCGLILGDLGLAQISDSISSSKDSLSFSVSSVISSGSVVSSSKSSKTTQKEDRKVICGTYAYNSPEALFGNHSKDSDAYALGMSMYAAFSGHVPFLSNRAFDEFFHPDGTVDNAGVIQKMLEMMHNRDFPKIEWCPLFRKLKEMPHGDEIYSCLKEVYDGLIEYDAGDRLSVNDARMKVESIAQLLPRLGEGWECPTIDSIIKRQMKRYEGDKGRVDDFGDYRGLRLPSSGLDFDSQA
ncbi:hypothetical protein ADUPG1_006376, partial [Aduncisulcus paluster]